MKDLDSNYEKCNILFDRVMKIDKKLYMPALVTY